MDQQRREAESGADGEIIRPVSYRPTEESAKSRVPLTPLQAVLLATLAIVAVILWFLFSANSVRLELNPTSAQASITGGLRLQIGDVWLLRPGEYPVTAEAPGYALYTGTIDVGPAPNQTHQLELVKLPGRVAFTTEPPGATVTVDGEALGVTPTAELPIPAGPVVATLTRERYQPLEVQAEIEGMERPQTVHGQLDPDWADVTIITEPEGAEVFIDEASTGQFTPAVVEILSGEHDVRLKAPGHKSFQQRVLVAAGEERELSGITLTRADSLLTVKTTPAGAGITLNGEFRGESPLELAVQSGVRYRLQAFRSGYASAERSVELAPGAERMLNLTLAQLTGIVVVQARPEAAELFVNGRSMGPANQTLELPTTSQNVEVRLPGYAGYTTEITPREGITQELRVKLLTVEEARLAALKPVITTAADQQLVLLRPSPFTMGASRREPGRRANETLHEVNLTRLFYLGRHEVTNEQYKRFVRDHASGEFQDHSLDEPELPVVNVSWQAAAAYCNWLSDLDGLPPFYAMEGDEVVAFNPAATGYRLPSEAEWAWAAGQTGVPKEALRFPWGRNLPPPDRYGNFADRSAAHLVGRVIFGYNDNHIVAAPVGTFDASPLDVFDLAGNVAEWVHDFYEIPEEAGTTDPLGPTTGEYHGIRGSSWMHGTITELRIPFRDYGTAGRQDVGFRIARYAEVP